MMSPTQFAEIQKRLTTPDDASTAEQLRSDGQTLLAEVIRLGQMVASFSNKVTLQLTELETDMNRLEDENSRLRKLTESTYFERDACIGLIAQMAAKLQLTTGTRGDRVVVDLPSGQVSWDFLESEAHLFRSLPAYENELQDQTVQEVYSKVMNPGFDAGTA